MSCPGPSASRNTPRISSGIGSGFTPSNTVYATPFIPRFTSDRGKKRVTAGAAGGKGIEFQVSDDVLAALVAMLTGVCAHTPVVSIAATAMPNPVERSFIRDITSYRLLEPEFGQRTLPILTIALQTRPTFGVKF